ncbi:hypothetical protein FBQ85_07505 [Cytophagia bacterium CHB2]|nr:hypothetical protein [Cytophagia bacterium CHB2]
MDDKKPDLQEISEQFREPLRDAIAKLESLHTSAWDSNDDIAKTTISVASVIVAFTVAFSGSMANPSECVTWKYIICASWVLFLLSIVVALVSLWCSRQARSTSIRFLENWPQLQEIIPLIISEPNEFENRVRDWHRETIGPIRTNTKCAERALIASLFLFAFAIIVLGVVGIRQIVF